MNPLYPCYPVPLETIAHAEVLFLDAVSRPWLLVAEGADSVDCPCSAVGNVTRDVRLRHHKLKSGWIVIGQCSLCRRIFHRPLTKAEKVEREEAVTA